MALMAFLSFKGPPFLASRSYVLIGQSGSVLPNKVSTSYSDSPEIGSGKRLMIGLYDFGEITSLPQTFS
jgi:hypothetical protein